MKRGVSRLWLCFMLALNTLSVFGYIGQFYLITEPRQTSAETINQLAELSDTEPNAIDPNQIATLVSEERTKRYIPELKQDQRLMNSAKLKCQDMVKNDYYDHVNPTTGLHGYEYIYDLVPEAGYVISENLYQTRVEIQNYSTGPVEIVKAWVDSKDHKKAMLSSRYNLTGVATCMQGGLITVVQHFSM